MLPQGVAVGACATVLPEITGQLVGWKICAHLIPCGWPCGSAFSPYSTYTAALTLHPYFLRLSPGFLTLCPSIFTLHPSFCLSKLFKTLLQLSNTLSNLISYMPQLFQELIPALLILYPNF